MLDYLRRHRTRTGFVILGLSVALGFGLLEREGQARADADRRGAVETCESWNDVRLALRRVVGKIDELSTQEGRQTPDWIETRDYALAQLSARDCEHHPERPPDLSLSSTTTTTRR